MGHFGNAGILKRARVKTKARAQNDSVVPQFLNLAIRMGVGKSDLKLLPHALDAFDVSIEHGVLAL